MKCSFAFIIFFFGCGNNNPYELPAPQKKTWKDPETKSDTIVQMLAAHMAVCTLL